MAQSRTLIPLHRASRGVRGSMAGREDDRRYRYRTIEKTKPKKDQETTRVVNEIFSQRSKEGAKFNDNTNNNNAVDR